MKKFYKYEFTKKEKREYGLKKKRDSMARQYLKDYDNGKAFAEVFTFRIPRGNKNVYLTYTKRLEDGMVFRYMINKTHECPDNQGCKEIQLKGGRTGMEVLELGSVGKTCVLNFPSFMCLQFEKKRMKQKIDEAFDDL